MQGVFFQPCAPIAMSHPFCGAVYLSSMYPVMDMVRSRDHGRVIPGWQAGRLGAYRGVLTVRPIHQPHLHRSVLTAQMTMEDRRTAAPPDLWDVRLVEITAERWVITGFERINDGLSD